MQQHAGNGCEPAATDGFCDLGIAVARHGSTEGNEHCPLAKAPQAVHSAAQIEPEAAKASPGRGPEGSAVGLVEPCTGDVSHVSSGRDAHPSSIALTLPHSQPAKLLQVQKDLPPSPAVPSSMDVKPQETSADVLHAAVSPLQARPVPALAPKVVKPLLGKQSPSVNLGQGSSTMQGWKGSMARAAAFSMPSTLLGSVSKALASERSLPAQCAAGEPDGLELRSEGPEDAGQEPVVTAALQLGLSAGPSVGAVTEQLKTDEGSQAVVDGEGASRGLREGPPNLCSTGSKILAGMNSNHATQVCYSSVICGCLLCTLPNLYVLVAEATSKCYGSVSRVACTWTALGS